MNEKGDHVIVNAALNQITHETSPRREIALPTINVMARFKLQINLLKFILPQPQKLPPSKSDMTVIDNILR